MKIIVAYDISDDTRRNNIYKILKDYGQWIQYSLFECDLDKKHYLKLRHQLDDVINNNQDNVRFYFLCEKCKKKTDIIGGPENSFEESIII